MFEGSYHSVVKGLKILTVICQKGPQGLVRERITDPLAWYTCLCQVLSMCSMGLSMSSLGRNQCLSAVAYGCDITTEASGRWCPRVGVEIIILNKVQLAPMVFWILHRAKTNRISRCKHTVIRRVFCFPRDLSLWTDTSGLKIFNSIYKSYFRINSVNWLVK